MTQSSGLTCFQIFCRNQLQDYLKRPGISVRFDHIEVDGEYPFEHGYLHTSFEHRGHSVEVFIYDRQIEFNIAGWSHSYEKFDYSNAEEQVQAMKDSLTRCLSFDPVEHVHAERLHHRIGCIRLVVISIFIVSVVGLIASLVLLEAGATWTWIFGSTAGMALLVSVSLSRWSRRLPDLY